MHSYPQIHNLGHRYISTLFDEEVIIEEKVDGSQFSFGKYGGNLVLRSKGAEIYFPVENNLFKDAAEYVKSIQDRLVDGWTYRGEVLFRPKHNSLTYERTPKHNIVIFDIDTGEEKYMTYEEKWAEANALDLETVPIFFEGKVDNIEQLKEFFNRDSFLGGTKIEGFVIKAYTQFGKDKKVLMGKWVSEAFKEVHDSEWKKANPGRKDIIESLISTYKTEARWNKAIQHLTELGGIEGSPRDIGLILQEIKTDVHKECADEIKEKLFEMAWPQIARGITAGLPEFYKTKLVESMFSKEPHNA